MEHGKTISPGWRVASFAATELALDAFYRFTRTLNLDLDAFWIYACVSNNSMRDAVLDPSLAARNMDIAEASAHFRPALSRRAIADKTGLPRETVRRRVKNLVERGLLECDDAGNVRIAFQYTQEMTSGLNDLHRAVQSYLGRLQTAQVVMPLQHMQGENITAPKE